MIKKILSLILALSMMAGTINCVFAETMDENENELSENVARIVFEKGGAVKSDRITSLKYQGPIEYIGGQYALRQSATNQSEQHIEVITDNDWLYAPNGTPVELSIEYFDQGKGMFVIRYNGTNDKLHWDGFASEWTDSEPVYLTNTGEWKTHTFYFEDMKAMQESYGWDFDVALWTHQYGMSTEDVYIRSITVEKRFSKEPVKVLPESGSIGQNFGPDEDKTINVKFENSTEYAFKTAAAYNVCDYNGSVLEEGTFEFDNTAYGVYEKAFDLNKYTKFGVYRLNFHLTHTVDYNGENVIVENDMPVGFSVINKSEVGEGYDVVNVQAHAGTWGIEPTVILASYAGFGMFREGVSWFNVEQVKDELVFRDEAKNFWDFHNEYQIKRSVTVGYTPVYYLREEENPPYTVYHGPKSDAALDAYARYAAFVLDNMEGVESMEFWNEYTYYDMSINSPETYTEMIKRAYTAVKAKKPDLTTIGMCTAQCDLAFIEGALKAGAYDYMDVVSFHPYDWSGGTYDLKRMEYYSNTVKDLFKQYGGEEKPIWYTEVGAATADSSAHYDEEEQGATAIKIFAVGTQRDHFEKMFWYDLVDDGNDNTYNEHRFGLVKSHEESPGLRYSAKPGFVQLAGLNKMMKDSEPVGIIETEDGLWLCNFKMPNGENIAIAWTEPGSEQNVDINLGAAEVEVFDMYSNSIGTMTSGSGVHTVALTTHPLYLKGNFNNFSVEKSTKGVDTMNYIATPDDHFEANFNSDYSGTLRVECESYDKITVSDVHDGKITMATLPEAEGNSYLTLKVYNNKDELIYVGQPAFTIADMFVVNLKSEQTNEKDADRWHIAVNVENSSNTKPITGTCRIIEINSEPVDGEPEIFDNLLPREDITLYLNLDEMVKKRNVSLKVEIAADDGYKQVHEQNLDFTSAVYAKDKPVIDGVVEPGEWDGMWLTADTKARASHETWGGPNDASVDCNLMWDEENLYLGAIMTDDIYFNDKTPYESWAGDSLQFGIENAIHRNDQAFAMGATGSGNFTEMGIALLNGKDTAVYRWSAQDSKNPTGEVTNCVAASTRRDNKTYFELAVPWTELMGQDYVLDESTIFGFSMLVNDNDGAGRKGRMEYNRGIGGYKNTVDFGRMKLIRQ